VQRQPNGDYLYLGRRDRQVKVRGHRVELDEIETALRGDDRVREAAVYALPDGHGSLLVEAAIVARDDPPPTRAQLVARLAEHLPAYALPADLVAVEALPRTSTGKTDYGALRARALERRKAVP
jgi:acyl-coenzyme A synthetase/AMP-(fatty) acid ligase